MRTVSMTWTTPFDWSTSAVVTVEVPPLAVGKNDGATGEGRGEVLALNGLECCLAITLLDHLDELLGGDLAGDDVVV